MFPLTVLKLVILEVEPSEAFGSVYENLDDPEKTTLVHKMQETDPSSLGIVESMKPHLF